MVKIAPLAIQDLISVTKARVLRGDVTESVASQVGFLELGEPGEVSNAGLAFIISENFVAHVSATKAKALVVQKSLSEQVKKNIPDSVSYFLECDDAYLALAHLSKFLSDRDPHADWTAGSTREIDATAKVHPSAKLGPGVVVCAGAQIGARTQLIANVVIGPEAIVGEDCVLFPGVVVYPKSIIGCRVRLHGNVVIGSDGFGYARGPTGSVKIYHLGSIRVGDDVEVGSGTTIDRGTLRDTIVERGAKIDNLCQIGHNANIKSHAILCGHVGMAGNVTVGQGAILAGKAGIADKVEIGAGAIVGPMTGVSKDIPPGEQVMSSFTSHPRREWWRLLVYFDKLPELFDRVKKLEKPKV